MAGPRSLVAFQGEPGAYSQMAIFQALGPTSLTLPCRTFGDTFRAVASGMADSAIIPIENSTAGSINETYDLLVRSRLSIIGEVYSRINHCLMARSRVEPKSLRVIHCHPQALAQCLKFLDRLPAEKRATYDTAGSAKTVAGTASLDEGAVASRLAASIYGLSIIAEAIETEAANTTRFIRVGRYAKETANPCKTSLCFELAHRPGSLQEALDVFASRNVNISKIESRPLAGRPFEYLFYVDVFGALRDAEIKSALNDLRRQARRIRVLGSYPVATPPKSLRSS